MLTNTRNANIHMLNCLETNNYQIFNADCRDILKNGVLSDAPFIHLCVTSPPYDNLRNYKNSLEWNFDIFKEIANQLYNIIVKGGVLVWIVNDQSINGSETGTSFKQALYLFATLIFILFCMAVLFNSMNCSCSKQKNICTIKTYEFFSPADVSFKISDVQNVKIKTRRSGKHSYDEIHILLNETEKNMKTRITELVGIKYPVFQGGMAWIADASIAAAVSNAGGLGLLGAGSMHPEILREHIRKCKQATDKPFGVNVPLMYPQIEEIMQILVEEDVKIVFTSAGNPKTWTPYLKEHGITVAHVVSSSKFARKCEEAGVDAIVAEGFEAGGHNGREETTTMCLIPAVRKATTLPLIAAGGIGTGRGMLAAMALGAEGVQIGTRFALTEESSAHPDFKNHGLKLNEGDTKLLLKKVSPTRLVKGAFKDLIEEAENKGASAEELREILGKGRAKKGIFEGDLENGELELGQIASLFRNLQSVDEVMKEITEEYSNALKELVHY